MKKFVYTAYISAAICLLSGCSGEPVGLFSASVDEEVEDVLAVIPEETEAETEAETTAPRVNHEPCEEAVLNAADRVEVYEKITLGELLAGTNVNLEHPEKEIDTLSVGPHEVLVEYEFGGELYEHTVSYGVVDTTPPVLLNSGWNAYVKRGEALDLNKLVGFADNYDRRPALTYTGYADTSVCGEYPITATAADASGNETSWDLTVRVVDEIPVPPDNNSRIAFGDFMQKYSGENVRFGIDVSVWQGEIDFEAVRDAGCSFVIMRMGHFYDEIKMDDYYAVNMARAKAAGLDVGVYIYTTANTAEEVRENARWIAQQLDGQELDFPVVFDWESFTNFQQYEMSIHDLNTYFELFAEEMEQYGYSSMLYSSKNFLNNFWYENEKYPVWLAHYTDQTDYTGEYVMWQASCFGRIDGINGDVDLNVLYTDSDF